MDKGGLSELLDEEEPPDGIVEEICYQDNIKDHEKIPKLVEHKTSQNKIQWKNFTTSKKKTSSLIIPKACVYPLVLSEGKICLIETLTTYS